MHSCALLLDHHPILLGGRKPDSPHHDCGRLSAYDRLRCCLSCAWQAPVVPQLLRYRQGFV